MKRSPANSQNEQRYRPWTLAKIDTKRANLRTAQTRFFIQIFLFVPCDSIVFVTLLRIGIVKKPNLTLNFTTHPKFGVRFGRWFCMLDLPRRMHPQNCAAFFGRYGAERGVPGRAGATPGFWPASRQKPCSMVLTTSRVAPARPGTSCLD
jgi:hypothetical protein